MPNFSGMWTLQAQMQAIAAGTWDLGPSNLFVWGNNGSGRLGLNDTANRSSPVQLGEGRVWSKVASGYECSVAIKSTGTLWSWGNNGTGQLGQNDVVTRSSPVQVGALTDWLQVSAGASHCAAIKTNGTLWTWGRNNRGQLGLNIAYNSYRSSPVQVGALTDWSQVSAGNDFCVAVKTNGTIWSWGGNGQGQLGQNVAYNVRRSSPVQVGALTDWSKVSSGFYACVAIKTDGSLWAWGYNYTGQLGLGNRTDRFSPVQVGALTDWSQVSSGLGFCSAIKTTGALWSWGRGDAGQLGQNDLVYRSSPVQVGALTDWSQVSARSQFCVAIKTNGTLWSWGSSSSGRLGQNNTTNCSSPIQVGASTTWSLIGQGCQCSHTLAITT